jgi:hypothetical protein
LVPFDWKVRFFDFGAEPNAPASAAAFARVIAGSPVRTDRVDRMDYISGRAIVPGVPADHLAIAAEGDVTVPTGSHQLRVISDEGARVWIDGTLAVDHWAPHESMVDVVPIAAGHHRLRVEYYENEGAAELSVALVRGRSFTGRHGRQGRMP